MQAPYPIVQRFRSVIQSEDCGRTRGHWASSRSASPARSSLTGRNDTVSDDDWISQPTGWIGTRGRPRSRRDVMKRCGPCGRDHSGADANDRDRDRRAKGRRPARLRADSTNVIALTRRLGSTRGRPAPTRLKSRDCLVGRARRSRPESGTRLETLDRCACTTCDARMTDILPSPVLMIPQQLEAGCSV